MNVGELFVYLGIVNGVVEVGYSMLSFVVCYFLVGIVVILMCGVIIELIMKFLM